LLNAYSKTKHVITRATVRFSMISLFRSVVLFLCTYENKNKGMNE